MKTFVKPSTLLTCVVLSIGLIACEKDSFLTPNSTASARTAAPQNSIDVSIPQVHKLTQYGEAKLTYAANGQLLSVTTPVRGSMPVQTDYTYTPGQIRAFTHQGKIVLHDETFTLDASGRCTESVEAGSYSDVHWIYTYTDKGQLWSCMNQNSCVGGITYNYNADGDMERARLSTGVSEGIDITFAYDQPAGAPLLHDAYPLNITVPRMTAHDTYLRIFGKSSKHLPKHVSYKPAPGTTFVTLPSDLVYVYSLDTDGFVTKKIEYNGQSGVLPKTVLYAYEMVNLVVNP
ncbi:hypothetical protein [Spirosoma sp.]|uniref:hypothetical protein n=1 Tax=Spirosoma sp. TaxID=1899569 RepID=UPI003B3B71D4